MRSRPSEFPLAVWLQSAETGDDLALTALWNRYYPDLVRFADQRLKLIGVKGRVADGEDVAASALGSFLSAVQRQRFHDVRDEQGILRFLFKITVWKVIDRKRKQNAVREVGESAVDTADGSVRKFGDLAWESLGPDLIAQMNEQIQRRMAELADDQLRTIACYRLEGYENREIAALIGCSLATVERRLREIRDIWTAAAEREQD